jgi:hypothetical protein
MDVLLLLLLGLSRHSKQAVECSALTRKAFGRLGIPGGTEEKFQRIAFRVDGPVAEHPGFSDFDVRLVDFPRVVARFQMRPRAFVEFRGIVLDESDRWSCDRHTIPVPALFLPGRDS